MSATCASSSGSSEYLVSYGLTGELGRFGGPAGLRRGTRVVIRTARGVEIGEVLRPASARLGALMGDAPAGEVLRATTEDDERQAAEQAARAAELLEGLPEALDCEVLLDGRTAVLQFAGAAAGLRERAATLATSAGLTLSVYDAGTAAEEGGCGSCGSGGGCGSGGCSTGCGGETSEVRAYFASLRTRMEETRRVTLL